MFQRCWCQGGQRGSGLPLDKYRVRHCASVNNEDGKLTCCLAKDDKCFECNRDECATLNMTFCVKEYLLNNKWPEYLKRKKGNSLDEKILSLAENNQSAS